MGIYPEAGLKEARARRDSARKQLAAGIDPREARKAVKAARGGADSLQAVAREWLAKYAPRWAPGHASKIIGRFERDIFPWLGPVPSARSRRPSCWRSCGASRPEAPSRQRTGRIRTAAGCSAERYTGTHHCVACDYAEPKWSTRSPRTRIGRSRPPITINQKKTLPPLAWAAGWGRELDDPMKGWSRELREREERRLAGLRVAPR